jgi:acylphosphatase
MADDRVRRRVTVRGRVQGVFFRDSVRQRAHTRNVQGWVTNRADGAVEAVLEGNPDDVQSVVRFMETGPRQADVETVDVRDEAPEGLASFEIR